MKDVRCVSVCKYVCVCACMCVFVRVGFVLIGRE